jgi:hypothetical protein
MGTWATIALPSMRNSAADAESGWLDVPQWIEKRRTVDFKPTDRPRFHLHAFR